MENDNGVLNPSSSSAAAPDQPQPSSAPRSEPTTSSTLFQELHSYPFNTDPEFKIGLAVILGHPNTPPTEEELRREDDLNLQAKCFYYSRKKSIQPPIDFSTYKSWLQSLPPSDSTSPPPQSLTSEPQTSTAATSTAAETSAVPSSSSTTAADATPAAEPAYPSSFAHIVELITTGQPIPGIQQIPDTVLTGKEAPSTAAKRRKPWEKEGDDAGDGDGKNSRSHGVGEGKENGVGAEEATPISPT